MSKGDVCQPFILRSASSAALTSMSVPRIDIKLSAGGSIPDTDLGLSQAELLLLRQQTEIATQRGVENASTLKKGRGTSRHSQSSSRAAAHVDVRSNRVGAIPMDSRSLRRIETALTNLMRRTIARIEQLEMVFEGSLADTQNTDAVTVQSADNEIRRSKMILRELHNSEAKIEEVTNVLEKIRLLRQKCDSNEGYMTSSARSSAAGNNINSKSLHSRSDARARGLSMDSGRRSESFEVQGGPSTASKPYGAKSSEHARAQMDIFTRVSKEVHQPIQRNLSLTIKGHLKSSQAVSTENRTEVPPTAHDATITGHKESVASERIDNQSVPATRRGSRWYESVSKAALGQGRYDEFEPLLGRDIDLHTDSGYASRCAMEKGIALENQNPHNQEPLVSMSSMDVSKSGKQYSYTANNGTIKLDMFVQAFVDLFVRDITLVVLGDISELLTEFAARLGGEGSTPELRQAMVFIYKHRSTISKTIHQSAYEDTILDSDESVCSSRESGAKEKIGLSSDDIKSWLELCKSEKPSDLLDDSSLRPSWPEHESDDSFESDLREFEEQLVKSPAYEWLVNTVKKRSELTITETEVDEQMRTVICKYLPKPPLLSRRVSILHSEAHFEMRINLKELAINVSEAALDSIIAITGSRQDTQATTCIQYVQQTWPIEGPLLWQITKDALCLPKQVASQRTRDSAVFSGHFDDDRLSIVVFGSHSLIVQSAQQICWTACALGVAMRPSMHGVYTYTPSLSNVEWDESSDQVRQRVDSPTGISLSRNTDDKLVAREDAQPVPFLSGQTQRKRAKFRVDIRSSPVRKASSSGSCWYKLFHRAVIINGFPILKRSVPGTGLELSLGLLVKLFETACLHKFKDTWCFKNFNAILYPIRCASDVIVWHLETGEDGRRVTYWDKIGVDQFDLESKAILHYRHVVGWCSNTNHMAGHVSCKYEVRGSRSSECLPHSVLHQCSLSFGRTVSADVNACLSSNHVPVSWSRQSYRARFRFLEQKYVVLWDEGLSRGWLINGLRVLLHLLRQSLKVDSDEDTGELFVLKAEHLTEPREPYSDGSAREFLSNPSNLATRISISNIVGTDNIYETLSDRLDCLYRVLEQAFDHQSHVGDWTEIPRSQLEGWDFLSIARNVESIKPSMLALPPTGWIWVDFIRSIKAVTLMGADFGDLLSLCTPVPCGRSYLATTSTDIFKMIGMIPNEKPVDPIAVTTNSSISWHGPIGAVTNCSCDAISTKNKTQAVQVLWPTRYLHMLPPPNSDFRLTINSRTTLVFGHDNSLEYHVPNIGNSPVPGPPPDATAELERIDSGIGSSVASKNATGSTEISNRSRGLSYNQQVIPRCPSSQTRVYGTNIMHGGYGIYGDITGNISVNQFFTSVLSTGSSSSIPQATRSSKIKSRIPRPARQSHAVRSRQASEGGSSYEV